MRRAAIYARISLDRKDGEGVARQLADCRKLAQERGWEVEEYVDNDVSAFRRKQRPEFDRMLADLHAGIVRAVIAYHPDRLYRRLADLELIVAAVESSKATVVTVRAGDIDLSNASGRMVARMLGAAAQHESERIGERVSRAKQQRAAEGRPAGGGWRAFGLNATWTEHIPAEAAVLREVAQRLREGSRWAWEANRLNELGVTRVSGAPWTVGTLRRTLLSPHVVGLRTYKGEVVGEAVWPPILDRETWDELRHDANGRKRGRPPSDRHLLTGLLVCGKCGGRLYANTTRNRTTAYRCPPVTGQGCGGVSISAPSLEAFVERQVIGWLLDPTVLEAVNARQEQPEAVTLPERVELDRRRKTLAVMWASGELSDPEYEAARDELNRRTAAIEEKAERPSRRPVFDVVKLGKLWPRMGPAEKRQVIGDLAEVPIVVAPAVKGSPLESRVAVKPAYS